MVMTREQVVELLGPARLKFIKDAILGGLAMYADPTNYGAAARLDHTPSVRAALRNCHILGVANRMLMEQSELGVRVVKKRNRVLFYIKEQVRLSFKMLDENMRHHNATTRQSLAFDAQLWPREELSEVQGGPLAQSLWSSDMMLPVTNVVGGYSALDQVEAQFKVSVICPIGKHNAWELTLTDQEMEELITESEPAKTAAIIKIQERRIRPRPGVIKNQDQDGSN